MSKTQTWNGIICLHDIPVEDYETNDGIVFLHNVRLPLGAAVADFSSKKVSVSYFISDTQLTEAEVSERILKHLFGVPDVDIHSSGHAYSEVTPDICWNHYNSFTIGGHDMNRELSSHEGKWLFLRVTEAET